MKTSLWLSLFLLPLASFGASNIEFNGLIVADGKTQVSLTDTTTGAFGWVPVGGNFYGYNVASYDEGNDTLSLKKGTLSINVKLKNAVIIPQAVPPPNPLNGMGGPNGPGPNQAVANNLRQINAAANQYFLATGKTSATMADLAQYLPAGAITPVNGENYSTLTINQGQPVSISNATGGTTTVLSGGRAIGFQTLNNPAKTPAGTPGVPQAGTATGTNGGTGTGGTGTVVNRRGGAGAASGGG